jgi:hypothetical protein
MQYKLNCLPFNCQIKSKLFHVNTLLTNHLRYGIQFVFSFCVTVATNPYRAMSFS